MSRRTDVLKRISERRDAFKSSSLVENVVNINKTQKKNPKKQRGRPGVRQIEPRALERKYQKRLKGVIDLIKNLVRINIVSKLPDLVAQADIERGKRDSERIDVSTFTQLKSLIQATRAQLTGPLSSRELGNMAREMAGETDQFNKDKLGKAFKALVGIDLAIEDPFATQLLDIFAEDNAELIINVSDELMAGIQADITRGLKRGTRSNDLAQKILGRVKDKEGFRSRFAKAETRARLIARDQINKLNGDLNRSRQEAVGVKKFIWRTSRDERVRGAPHSHKLEGEIFTWTGLKSESGKVKPRGGLNPGEDFFCRCYAEPFLEDL